MKLKIQLFITGFLQVLFVAINTFFIGQSFYFGVFICGFTISIIWSWNVKKIAFGSINDRLTYAIGAAFGSLLGLILAKFILFYKIL
jgi:hypothetical protein